MEHCKPVGIVRATLRNDDGTIADERRTINFITTVGAKLIADRLSDRDDSGGDFSHIAIGTGTGQDVSDTALDNEIARVAFDVGYPDQGTTPNDNQIICQSDFAAGTGTGSITEGGVYNEASGGTLTNYFVFDPPIEKAASQNLVVTVYFIIGSG